MDEMLSEYCPIQHEDGSSQGISARVHCVHNTPTPTVHNHNWHEFGLSVLLSDRFFHPLSLSQSNESHRFVSYFHDNQLFDNGSRQFGFSFDSSSLGRISYGMEAMQRNQREKLNESTHLIRKKRHLIHSCNILLSAFLSFHEHQGNVSVFFRFGFGLEATFVWIA